MYDCWSVRPSLSVPLEPWYLVEFPPAPPGLDSVFPTRAPTGPTTCFGPGRASSTGQGRASAFGHQARKMWSGVGIAYGKGSSHLRAPLAERSRGCYREGRKEAQGPVPCLRIKSSTPPPQTTGAGCWLDPGIIFLMAQAATQHLLVPDARGISAYM